GGGGGHLRAGRAGAARSGGRGGGGGRRGRAAGSRGRPGGARGGGQEERLPHGVRAGVGLRCHAGPRRGDGGRLRRRAPLRRRARAPARPPPRPRRARARRRRAPPALPPLRRLRRPRRRRGVSNYCRERLHVVLSKELRRPPSDLGEMSDVDMKEHWDDLFTRCFQTVDDEVSGLASRLVHGQPRSDPIAAENVGSTAVAVVVCSSHVVVANCGDSRIVLSRGKEPVALSIDQKPDRKDERARIEAAGGKVIQWNGHRVSGILAMSRSIGDRYLKPYIIPKPEVTIVPRAKDDDCLILASDGLWDVVSNEEACKVARRQIQQWHKNNSVTTSSSDGGDGSTDPAAQAAADYLTRLALKKGSQDNITVIVVDLKPRRKPKNNS
uniref:protein-serine/threonine phosphatase n=1 Tax=Aegilops tauschii subsp. strangulata TaxID=200361 RepID=A0A452ZP92_AEGTS